MTWIEKYIESRSATDPEFKAGVEEELAELRNTELSIDREAWLSENPEAAAMVAQGIRESMEGKGRYLGSFAEYANIDLDD